MKCGTTSLFSYLAEHPQIAPCSSKEPCFFSKEDNWKKGYEWYQQLWKSKEIDWRIIEATKYYKQIDEYYQRFPASDILLLDFATLKQNPTRLLREICLFLDIDSGYEFKVSEAHNVSKNLIVNSPIWNLMRKNLLLRSRLKKIISPKQKNILRSMLGSKFNEEIEFSASQKQRILNELQPDLEKLKLHFNFDTSSWKI